MIAIEEIEAARERIAGAAVRTPLVRLRPRRRAGRDLVQARDPAADQLVQDPRRRERRAQRRPGAAGAGLVTASAGNMAQGVAWIARELGVSATIAVPEHAPAAKLDGDRAARRHACSRCPTPTGGSAIVSGRVEGVEGLFVHPVADPAVMAGNGTIGLEILEDLPDLDAVVIPYGGGGLTHGHRQRAARSAPADAHLHGGAGTGAAAMAAARAAGEPDRGRLPASWVDGSGSRWCSARCGRGWRR